MKCSNCNFDAPINEWKMQEKSGLIRLPEEAIKKYEGFVDQKDASETLKWFVKSIFRTLSEFGFMPYHEIRFICPKCGAKA